MDLGYDYYEFSTTQIEGLLRELVIASPCLERLVLIAKRPCYQQNRLHPTLLEDFLFSFVSQMKNLAALCLVGFEMDPIVLAGVKQRLKQEILRVRPSLWMHIGPELPNATDPSVPKIHYDDIVNPFDPYCAPPKLF